jgi:hypothetical protein
MARACLTLAAGKACRPILTRCCRTKDIADIYAFVQSLPGPGSAKDIAILNN